MPDGGLRLRETLMDPDDLWHWDRILALLADVQSDLADRIEELIEIGVPDRRLPLRPRLYDALLEDSSAVRLGQPEGVSLATPQMERAFEIATPLNLICGALGWQPYVSRYPEEFPANVSTWLHELLDVMRQF